MADRAQSLDNQIAHWFSCQGFFRFVNREQRSTTETRRSQRVLAVLPPCPPCLCVEFLPWEFRISLYPERCKLATSRLAKSSRAASVRITILWNAYASAGSSALHLRHRFPRHPISDCRLIGAHRGAARQRSIQAHFAHNRVSHHAAQDVSSVPSESGTAPSRGRHTADKGCHPHRPAWIRKSPGLHSIISR